MFIPYDERQELYHHGILGMHWGIRRYQPYPQGEKKGKEVGAALQVKQRPKKRKLSKDAKMRAKMRNDIKNQELRTKLEAAKNEKRVEKDKQRAMKSMSEVEKYQAQTAKDKAAAEAARASVARREAEQAEYVSKEQKSSRKVAYGSFKTEYGKLKAIRSGNPKKVKRYAKMMTTEEYKEAIERCRAANDLKIQNIEMLSKAGEKFAGTLKNAASVAGSVISIHDDIATVKNAMDKTGKKWTIWKEDKAAKARAEQEHKWKTEEHDLSISERKAKQRRETSKMMLDYGIDPRTYKPVTDPELLNLISKRAASGKGGKGLTEDDIIRILMSKGLIDD